MAIFQCHIQVISRGEGRSVVSAAAYRSASRIENNYTGLTDDYTQKGWVEYSEIILPANAPGEWNDRAVLWNAVEEAEKSRDCRLAREIEVALPQELSLQENIRLVQEFVQDSFVSNGMIADINIHNPPVRDSSGIPVDADGNRVTDRKDMVFRNPHAHILLTLWPLDENGRWMPKTEKEYLCSRDGEERGFTAAEFKAAQADGWEKQYQYKVGRKKVYMTPSAAEEHGYERASKYPKSTKYGRQNPISERWNSEEQLLIWRKAWADVTNKYLERYGHEERIDHRSFVERGIDEQPTIHEGVIARALEQKGIVSDRCELNRQIKADNRLLRELKAQFKKITEAVKNTLPAIAEALEKLRENMLIFCYQLGHIRSSKKQMTGALNILKPNLAQYRSLVQQIKETTKERKSLLAEKKSLPAIHFVRHRELASKIAELTEKLEELKSEKAMLLHSLEYPEDATSDIFQRQIDRYEDNLKRLEAQENKYAGELEAALSEYAELKEQASGFDSLQLYLERKALRPDREKAAAQRIEAAYGDKFSWWLMESGLRDVSGYLDEYAQEKTMDRELRQRRRSERLERKMKNRDMER